MGRTYRLGRLLEPRPEIEPQRILLIYVYKLEDNLLERSDRAGLRCVLLGCKVVPAEGEGEVGRGGNRGLGGEEQRRDGQLNEPPCRQDNARQAKLTATAAIRKSVCLGNRTVLEREVRIKVKSPSCPTDRCTLPAHGVVRARQITC